MQKGNISRIFLPKEYDNILTLKNHRFKERLPFIVYVDIDCLLELMNESDTNTFAYQKHFPTSVAYLQVNIADTLTPKSINTQSHIVGAMHYYTVSGLAFDAMLKFSKIELELITDVEILFLIKSCILGGVSQCFKRYSKANM